MQDTKIAIKQERSQKFVLGRIKFLGEV